MKKLKKILAVMGCVAMVFSMAVCFADNPTGSQAMVSALTDSTTGITSNNLWSEAVNFAPIITALFVFAFGYRICKRLLGGGSKGKVKI